MKNKVKRYIVNKKNIHNKFLNSDTAITLVALIITIIILLILATITLNMLLGDGGILKKAQVAKEKTNLAQKDEEEKLSEIENEIEKYSTGRSETKVPGEYRFLSDSNGFKNIQGEVEFSSLGIKPKTWLEGSFEDYLGGANWPRKCKIEKQLNQPIKLSGKFEFTVQMLVDNSYKDYEGIIAINLLKKENENYKKTAQIVLEDWTTTKFESRYFVKINDIEIINSTVNAGTIWNTPNVSGRYSIVGDGEKVNFYFGDHAYDDKNSSIDYTRRT